MSQSDLLDILLGLILVLVAMIGLWQGIVRTLLYLAGALLGSELALWWSDNIGDLLADWFPLSIETGRFVAATGLIVASMVLVGSGFSSLIWRYPRDWRNRAGGLLAGLGLGALTLGLILRYYFIFLQESADAALGDTRIAGWLWSDFNWVIAAVALSLMLMIIVGWVLGPPEPDQAVLRVQQMREEAVSRQDRYPAQAPASADLYAGGSAIDSDANSSGGYPVLSTETYFPPPDDTLYANLSTNGPEPPETKNVFRDDIQDTGATVSAFESTGLRDLPDYASQQATATESLRPISTRGFTGEDLRERRESAGICPNCGMLLRTGDAFCPDCGFPVEA